jgi:hypothetical protein
MITQQSCKSATPELITLSKMSKQIVTALLELQQKFPDDASKGLLVCFNTGVFSTDLAYWKECGKRIEIDSKDSDLEGLPPFQLYITQNLDKSLNVRSVSQETGIASAGARETLTGERNFYSSGLTDLVRGLNFVSVTRNNPGIVINEEFLLSFPDGFFTENGRSNLLSKSFEPHERWSYFQEKFSTLLSSLKPGESILMSASASLLGYAWPFSAAQNSSSDEEIKNTLEKLCTNNYTGCALFEVPTRNEYGIVANHALFIRGSDTGKLKVVPISKDLVIKHSDRSESEQLRSPTTVTGQKKLETLSVDSNGSVTINFGNSSYSLTISGHSISWMPKSHVRNWHATIS